MGKLRLYERLYACGGLSILLASTLFWSINNARIQGGNADQLVSAFLFENGHTFSGAVFPASHTQLIKWPLFLLLRVFHFSALSFVVVTVLLSVITVAAFAYVLYRVCKNTMVFGVLCLAVAVVLLQVPAQIHGGVTAPLSIAMLSGRNVEYVWFIAALWLCAKSPYYISRQFWLGVILLGLLFASDHLFLYMSLGGAAALFVATLFVGRFDKTQAVASLPLQRVANIWLSAGVAAWVIALLVQGVAGQLTHFISDAPPYALLKNWHTLLPAGIGTAQAVGLNFGIRTQGGWLAVVPVGCNILILATVVFASYQLAKKYYEKYHRSSTSKNGMPPTDMLAIMLLATSTIAVLAYLIFDQAYVTDARYISIVLFGGFLCLAVYGRNMPRILHATAKTSLLVAMAAVVATVAVTCGLVGNWRQTQHVLATDHLRQNNQRVARILQAHHTQYLVGNYWRVFPIRLLSGNNQSVVALRGCNGFAPLLNSQAWQPDLRVHSFAYLVSTWSFGITSPACNERLVASKYGQPTAKVIVAGNNVHPQEVLLFYDNGASRR